LQQVQGHGVLAALENVELLVHLRIDRRLCRRRAAREPTVVHRTRHDTRAGGARECQPARAVAVTAATRRASTTMRATRVT
jgi:hypothetical protein